jgi:hypothetical protein
MSVIRLSDSNITSVGTLTSLTVGGDLNADSHTLYVDSTNNRIGVGTNIPSVTLDVNGAVKGTTTAKVWINFAPGVSPTIRSSYGVSSITRITDGRYRINFSTAFSDSNYIVTGCSQRNGINGDSRISVVGSDSSYTTPQDNMTSTYVNIETSFSSQSYSIDIYMGSVAIFAT